MGYRSDIHTYEEALAELRRALTFGINPSLERLRLLAQELRSPQTTFAAVQVTGTNGKTSTVRLIDAFLRASGVRSAFYTSPELIDETERIVIDGTAISENDFAADLDEVIRARARLEEKGNLDVAQITQFELLTALAFVAFRNAHVDFGVLEVGLGGRWDATSVADPCVAVVTGIGLDHTKILGNTREEIAADKAMIIKPGCTPVLGAGFDDVLPIFLDRCTELDLHPRLVRMGDEPTSVPEGLTTRIYIESVEKSRESLLKTTFSVKTPHAFYGRLTMNAPQYQAQNAAVALTAAEAALGRSLTASDVKRALDGVTFPARFEVLRTDPYLIFDGGHNPQAATYLARNLTLAGVRPIAAFGAFSDKDVAGIVRALQPSVAGFIALDTDNPRAMGAADLARLIESTTGPPVLGVLESPALEDILQVSGDAPLVITGSLSLYILLKSYITGDI